ncbi:MFS transporter [Spongiactinospora rosea]|uniref:MFS transporter n=1 Tax=Spongiactinospora rosea TaxID=2248750 RepID=A0A366LUN7_9ACTN|nr:MFS transporter [Spongiactinospora rosea]
MRLLRAAAFAAVSVMLGVGAHAFAGGSVSAVSALVALLFSFGPAHALAGRERPLAVILPMLAAAQAGLHVLFSAAHAAEPQAAHAHGHSAAITIDLGMLVMHGWAVVLAAIWLARGEALLWALIRRFAVRLAPVLIAAPVPYGRPITIVPAEHPVPRYSLTLGHGMGRRGPPGALLTVSA